MTLQEAPVTTRSANSHRNRRPLAAVVALALATACSAGRINENSTAAQRELFGGMSATATPPEQAARITPVLLDCVRHPKGMGAVAAAGYPDSIGHTYLLGTYNAAAPLKPDGQKAVVDGVTIVHEGDRRYSVAPASDTSGIPHEVLDFNGDNSDHVARFAINGAAVTVESVPMQDNQAIKALVATIVCAPPARS